MNEHFIAFWNVENLFDVSSSPDRPDYLKRKLRNELRGWTASVLKRKITQLVRIISQMNNGTGPDILCVCEIENERVVAKLLDAIAPTLRRYSIAHADTKDGRGIDVAVIYDADKYSAGLQFNHFVQKRTATRDIFQVNLKTSADRDLVIIGNHWPSRSAGQYESEPYRIMVAETLSYFHSRILEELGDDTAIVCMGDFNDEPFDRSITNYAMASREPRKVMNSRSVPYFHNLMWELAGERLATYYFGNQPNVLDQFWVSKGILKRGSPFRVEKGSVDIFRPKEMISGGDYPGARFFKRPSEKKYDPDGYSDHFPIVMKLLERPKV